MTVDDNKARVGECGGIDVIVSVMKTHMNNSEICQQGCGTFMNIMNNGKI